ncbi:MAG: hypothetical protein ACI909_002136 [Planctomycetota bacterium]|jgi:uncharacterized protein YyaL (SSP411 family)
MHTLLKSQSADPMANFHLADRLDPPSLANTGISPRLRQKLLSMHVTSFDWKQGGLKTPIKFLDRDSIEYSLNQAAMHDKNEERMARLSLTNGMGLLDPDNGGIYQFATQNSWQQSHYSKTIAAQAGSLRLYALAHALLREHDFLKTARNIRDYLREKLLTPEGVFQSLPSRTVVHIDEYKSGDRQSLAQISTRENGWTIEALATFYEFSGDPSALAMAKNAAEWISSNRRVSDGGFKANGLSEKCLQLSDNLAMARAFLQMYRATTDTRYLRFADDTAKFICSNFSNTVAGFNSYTANVRDQSIAPQIDENICLSRFLNLLYYYTDKNEYLEMARHGLRYLAIPQVATSRMEEAGILLLDEEISSTPLKVIIMADKNDRKAAKLQENALRTFGWYKVIHWQDAKSNAV